MEKESKFRENLRYTAYILGSIGAAVVLGLVYIFIDPIIEFILAFIWPIVVIGMIAGGLAVILFLVLVFFKDEGDEGSRP